MDEPSEQSSSSVAEEASETVVQLEASDLEQRKQTHIPVKSSQSLEEFKEELRVKREQRQSIVSDLRNEVSSLKAQLAEQKAINVSLQSGDQQPPPPDVQTDAVDRNKENIVLKSELAEVQLALQLANAEILSLTSELSVTQKQVVSLKEVIVVTKQMISIRESQMNQVRVNLW